jgi:hypothetical protein
MLNVPGKPSDGPDVQRAGASDRGGGRAGGRHRHMPCAGAACTCTHALLAPAGSHSLVVRGSKEVEAPIGFKAAAGRQE